MQAANQPRVWCPPSCRPTVIARVEDRGRRSGTHWALLVLVALLTCGAATVARAQRGPAPGSSAADAAPARPRVALVLSGGGARGFAHVGVLRALREMRVPVDMVAGVSMGAVVGGAYASGRTVDELQAFVSETDWSTIISDRPPRDDLAFRRREDDLLLPSRIEFGLTRGGLVLPPSTAGNAALEATLARLLPEGTAEERVDRLPLPFRSAACDLLTGELVVLSETPLYASLRASLSVPGVFSPVRVQERLLIDGGLVRNLPVDLARAMGAEVVIAVNVGTPPAPERELGSAIGVARQMLNILTEQNVQRSLAELTERDVLIAPDLSGVSFLNFGAAERAIAAGEEAARRMAHRLQALAVSPQAYAAIEATRVAAPAAREKALPLARLEVQGTPHASSAALAAQLGLQEGRLVTMSQVNRAAARLFGRGEFERVPVEVYETPLGREVRVSPQEAEWARSRLRVGLEMFSDFSDDHRFTVSALHILSWLNPWGAELRTMARIGSERSLLAQLWQPLAPGSDWHFVPSLQARASSFDFYSQGLRAQRVGYEIHTATLAFGRQFSGWGNLQLGIDWRRGKGRLLIAADGQPVPEERIRESAAYLQLQLDTLDSLALPTRGVLLTGRFERARAGSAEVAGLGVSARGQLAQVLIGLAALRLGDWATHVYGEWSRSQEGGVAPLALGGFLRLSGTARESVSGRAIAFARFVAAHRVGEMPPGFGGAVRLGLSVEAGMIGEGADAVRFGSGRQAASAFVSVDTRFGPAFLAFGATRGGAGTMYLFLGPFW